MPGTVPSGDAQIVNSIRRGETGAEADLYHRYGDRVYYLALQRLRSRDDAEDVRAETFLRVIETVRRGDVRSPEAIPSFVLGVARNVILETLRERSKTNPLEDRVGDPAGTAEFDGVFLDSAVLRAIDITMRRLKPRERDFVRMHYYEELPKEEIARRTGIKEERVRLVKSRALKSFREIYQRVKKIVDTNAAGASLNC
jgi:RNA polymerase sigma-70 factor, ECF subfamily